MENNITLKLRLFIFIIGAANASFSSFLPVYYSNRGLTYTQIGIAFSTAALINMVFQPVWGYISDKYLDKRRVLFITLAVSTAIIMLFIKAGSFWTILPLIIINNIFMCSIIPILNAYIFDVVETVGNLNYSSFRFMSSMAFGITNLLLGYIIRSYGINSSFITFAILAVTGMLLLFSMKYKGKKGSRRIELKDVKPILVSTKLRVFLFTVFLMSIVISGDSNFMNELVKYNNGDVSKLGMVWFITCVFEVITFISAGKLMKRFDAVNVYFISMLIFGTKLILNFIFKSAASVIIIQFLEGIGFALYLSSSLEYLNRNIEPRVRASAMSIYAAFGGLGSFSAGLLGGMMLNVVNPRQFFLILAAVCFIASIFAFSLKSNGEKKLDLTIAQ